MGPAP